MSCKRRESAWAGVVISLAATWTNIALAQEAGTQVAASADQNASTDQAFDVFELRVLGNTVLPGRDIEQTVYPFLGRNKTLKDMEAARVALETFYHQRGYDTVYVDIPEQTVDSGIVRLKVTEATLHSVQVSGARYFSGREIKAALPAAQEGKTPSIPELQAQLAQLNAQSGDRVVVPVLKAGSTPGTVDLTLKVDDHLPLHASLELNNQYTASTKPLRAIAGVSYDNLFGRFDSIGVQYQTAPQDRRQVDVWMFNYGTNLFDSVTRLAFYYFKSNSQVATLATADASVTVLGNGQVGGVRLIQPVASSATSLQSLTLGFDYKNFLEDIRLQSAATSGDGGNSGSSGLSTPITYANVSLGYSGGWRRERTQWTFGASANFGIRSWQNDTQEFENKRYKARPNYFDVRSEGRVRFTLPANFSLQLRYSGQYAADPIISNEQFAIAGADGVRGYLEAEALADRGVKAAAQFGLPEWSLFKSKLALNAFTFFDYGVISVVNPLPEEITSTSLQSWGAGVDLSAFSHMTGSLVWAYPLKDATHTQRGDSRVLFNVRTTW
ncbi:MAG: ShlB/FhaC/HecB family hemolysin secretion/activation protein [Steroidobacteraceae bacterium]